MQAPSRRGVTSTRRATNPSLLGPWQVTSAGRGHTTPLRPYFNSGSFMPNSLSIIGAAIAV